MTGSRTIELTGFSGERYTFANFDEIPEFPRKVACVFFISCREEDDCGGSSHRPIFIGQTDDFNKRFDKTNILSSFQRHNFNCVSILSVNDPALRAGVALDLINGLLPLYDDIYKPINPGRMPLQARAAAV